MKLAWEGVNCTVFALQFLTVILYDISRRRNLIDLSEVIFRCYLHALPRPLAR
jgi:hypothetical protein